jgi:hypothetical protein
VSYLTFISQLGMLLQPFYNLVGGAHVEFNRRLAAPSNYCNERPVSFEAGTVTSIAEF